MSKLIGISGKPGSNKMFYAFRIIRELRFRGYSTDIVSLAKPLYQELNNIADQVGRDVPVEVIIDQNDLGIKGFKLLELLSPELIGEKNADYGYSRRNEFFRQALNILGTEIRREQNPNYFLNKLEEQTNKLDFGVLIDLRFPNEADYITEYGGMTIRVNLYDDKNTHGGYKYNEGMKQKSETALDEYPLFDYEFNREFFNGIKFGYELEKFFKIPSISQLS